MHSSFTYNPNAHRASNYQQQSGHQPVYTIGAPYAGFMSHPNVMNHQTFARSFASVVSCERDLGKPQNMNNTNNCHNNSGMGFINSFFNKHFNRPTMPHYQTIQRPNKEFEDFTRLPSLPASNYMHTPNHPPPHFYQQPHHINMKIPLGQFYPQSAQVHPQSANDSSNSTRSFMTSLFSGYQQCPQPQTKPKQRKWFGRGFRCGRGGENRWRTPKFHENDVNLQKNIHEKERTIVEHDIQDDICDFVHVDKDVMERDACDNKASSNNPNETAKGSTDDLPFMICSMIDFPAIVPLAPAPPAKPKEKEKCEEGFVVLPQDVSKSTPCFVPRRFTLCEKVEQIIKSSPTRINGYLKPCLKQSRRRYSECSDVEIEFERATDDEEAEEIDFSDDESETESEDEEDGVDGTCFEEDDDETSDEEDLPEHQLDSGVEERRVRFNLTPKVHVMRVWNCAYRLSRKGDIWQQVARDTERFRNRVKSLKSVIDPVLAKEHRQRVYQERFAKTD